MLKGVRVVVTGASGNIGTAMLRWLLDHPAVDSVAAIARHPPSGGHEGAAHSPSDGKRLSWHSADLTDADPASRLTEIFVGADAVVHLAWRITGDRDRRGQERTNRRGSAAVLEAARRARVGHLTFLSSAAVYSPAPPGARVAEDWPRRGIPGSSYSADKVAVEDMLDRAEADAPRPRIVRVRPPAVLQTAAAREVTAMALGRLAPLARLTGGRLPLLPLPSHTRTQLVAAEDVADLVGRALLSDASGAFNVADDPVLAPADLAALLGGRHVPAPAFLIRAVVDVTFRLRLQRLNPSWLDVLLRVPLLDCARARTELGWRSSHDARALLASIRDAVASGQGASSPPL